MKASRENQVDEEGHNDRDDHYLEKSSRDLSPFHPDLHLVHHPDLSQVLHNGHDGCASDSFHYRTMPYGLINCETRSAEAQSVVGVPNILSQYALPIIHPSVLLSTWQPNSVPAISVPCCSSPFLSIQSTFPSTVRSSSAHLLFLVVTSSMYCCPYLPPVLASASSDARSPQATAIKQATAINQPGTKRTAISGPCCSNSPVHLPLNYPSSFAFPCRHFL